MRAAHSNKKLPIIFGCTAMPIFLLYVYHNPARWDALFYFFFPDSFYYYNLSNELNLLHIALIWLAGYGAGKLLFRLLKPPQSSVPNWIIAIAAGWGLIAYLMFVLTLLHLLHLFLIYAVVLLFAVYGFWDSPINFTFLRNGLGSGYSSWKSMSWSLRFIAVMIAVTVFYAVISSLMPPTQSDGLRYHLTVPKLYLWEGGFYLIPNLSFSNFPFLIEYLFLIPLSLEQNSIPKLIHCSYFILTLFLLFYMGKKTGGSECAWISVLLVSATPFVPIFASWSFIEFGLTFYTLLAFALVVDWCEARRDDATNASWNWLLYAGMAAGLAVSCKYTALASAAAVAGFVFLSSIVYKKSYLSWLGFSVTVFWIAVLISLPWFLKNWILLGNPVYPFAGGVFPTPGWSELNATFFAYHAGIKGAMNVFKQMPIWWQIGDIVTLPFYATFFPGEIYHQPYNFGSWPLGAVWLASVPLLLLNRQWNIRTVYHILFAVFLFLLWALTYRDTRFLLPCLAVLAPVSALVLWNACRCCVWPKILLLVLIGYNLCQTSGLMMLEAYAPWWVVKGMTTEEEFLLTQSPDTRIRNHAFQYLEANTKRDETVLLHGIEQTFYCPNDAVFADWFDTDPLIEMSWEVPSVEELIAVLKEQGVQYIVHDYGNIHRYNTPRQPYYRFFCLPQEKSLPLLNEWVANEKNRVLYPAVYKLWYPEFMRRLNRSYETAPNVQILQTLLNGGVLEEVYRFDPNENDPTDGIRILKM